MAWHVGLYASLARLWSCCGFPISKGRIPGRRGERVAVMAVGAKRGIRPGVLRALHAAQPYVAQWLCGFGFLGSMKPKAGALKISMRIAIYLSLS